MTRFVVVGCIPLTRSADRSHLARLHPFHLSVLSAGCLLLTGCRWTGPPSVTDGERPPHTVAGPATEFPTPFSAIRAVLTLPDGRLVVSDPQENRVTLIDLSKGTGAQLGGVGDGPREFRRAGGLYRARGGGVVLFDQEARRLLPILPSGALEDAFWPPALGAAAGWSTHGPDALRVDSLGYAYSAIRLGDFTAQTAVLLRYRPGAAPDTVTQLRRPITRALDGPGQGIDYQEVLFSPEDAWTVAPDGRIAVVRAAPYLVEWFPVAGPPVAGPRIRHRPLSITPAEKHSIASGEAGSRGRYTVTIGRAPAGGAPARARVPVPMAAKDLLFAKVKTPINLRAGRWPLLDESGRLWVERTRPAESGASVFDVFDDRGRLVDRIALPAGSRLLGVDRRWIYSARVDADDLEYLQRFPLRPGATTPEAVVVTDSAAVAAATAAFHQALRANDLETFMSYVAEDVFFMPPGEPPVRGRDAVRQWMTGFLAQYRTSALTLADRQVLVGKGWAVELGTFEWALRQATGGAAVVDRGNYMQVWKEQSDKTWRFAREVYNSSVPAAPAAAK